MVSHDEPDISLDDLALEPVEAPSAEAASKGRAKFQIDTRSGGERRKAEERRAAIRFQDDRRSGKDRRRGGNGWTPGVDI